MLVLQYGPPSSFASTLAHSDWYPALKFLGVTIDRTLSFGSHVYSFGTKFFPRFKALRFIASASWGLSTEFLSQLHKTFIRPVLSYASLEWFPFLCNTLKTYLEVFHRSCRKVTSGCLASTPVPLLFLESLTPKFSHPLEITLNH